jgi:hypothetical protein
MLRVLSVILQATVLDGLAFGVFTFEQDGASSRSWAKFDAVSQS